MKSVVENCWRRKLCINAGDKIGLVGPNLVPDIFIKNNKRRLIQPTSGDIISRVKRYLPQNLE